MTDQETNLIAAAIAEALQLAVRNAESRLYMQPANAPAVDRAALKTEIRRYRMGLAAAMAHAAGRLPTYEECGCCDHLHRPEFNGDCRDDTERFTLAEIEDSHGAEGFELRELAEAESAR